MAPFIDRRSHFELVRELGGSNLGANNAGISLVRNIYTGKLLIEKRLKSSDVRNGCARREIEILKQLRRHPNITHLVEYELFDSSTVRRPNATIWMEYCKKGSIEDLIKDYQWRQARVPEALLWHIFSSLAEAVRYCQRGNAGNRGMGPRWNSVHHRDIQPRNVFLSSQIRGSSPFPRVVLGDFGCSTTRALMAAGITHPTQCSRQDMYFAPPEAPYFDTRSDIYQIGLVMFCLIFTEVAPDGWHDPAGLVEHDHFYSGELRYLICECLTQYGNERLGVEALVRRLGEYDATEMEFCGY